MMLESIDLRFGDTLKKSDAASKSINTNIAITSAANEKNRLNIDFEYTVTYVPQGNHIRIGGSAVFSGEESKKAFLEWKKTGRITGKAGEFVMNAINYSSSINSVLLAKTFNMAPPIMLASLVFEGK